MTKKYVGPGEVIPFTVAGSAVTSGQGYVLGSIVGVIEGDAAVGATGQLRRLGVVTMTKLGSDDITAAGTKVYWDDGNSRLTTTASTHMFAGWSYDAPGTATTMEVILAGGDQPVA